MSGSSNETLAGTNTYQGSTQINKGVLSVGSANALTGTGSSITGGSPISVNEGGSLAVASGVSLPATETINLNGGTILNPSGSTTFTGAVNGPGALTVTSSGTTTFSAAVGGTSLASVSVSGGTTNTPSLAAGQQMLTQLHATAQQIANPGIAYAVAYPFGIIGILLTMGLMRMVFKVDVPEHAARFARARDVCP